MNEFKDVKIILTSNRVIDLSDALTEDVAYLRVEVDRYERSGETDGSVAVETQSDGTVFVRPSQVAATIEL